MVLHQAFGTPSMFGNGRSHWYNSRSSCIARFVQGGVVKTFRWATEINQMSMRFHGTCPICNALIGYELSGDVICPHCNSELLVGNSDPTWHDLTEIDPDIGGGALGVFHVNLHPVGTLVCVACQQIYPNSFECCPKLVDLALTSYRQKTKYHGPKTDERIAQFLRDNERAVHNTIRLRTLEAEHGQLDKKTVNLIKTTLKHLDMLHLMEAKL